MSPKKDELPKSVKVGWRTYKVQVWDHKEAVGSDRYGETQHTTLTIRIDLTYGRQQAASTLLHEILHACSAVWNYRGELPEEPAIQIFQHGLSTVWRDNPEVMAWIGHNLQAAD